MRLIDADELIEKAYWHGERPDVGNPFAEGVEAVDMSDIDNAPTIYAEPVRHGRWEWKDFHGDGSLTLCCSECLETEGAREISNYCHNCGAKMDKE